ncbi:MAG: hypothetical protein HY257_04175 [Chloroflexi bacterium]|nr:hypothetical protein [Chloroflexota bacterium]
MSSYYGKHTRRAVNQYYSPDDFENQSPRSGIPFFLFFALLACIVGAVIVPGGLGAWVGYQELQEQNKGNAELHYQRGLGYLDENYPELAYTEFVIALKYDPTHAAARQKFDELDKSFGARSTPGAMHPR